MIIGSAKTVSDHHAVSRKVKKRLSRLLPQDALVYMDNWGSDVSRTVREYGLSRDPIALEQGYEAALSLVAAYELLRERQPV